MKKLIYKILLFVVIVVVFNIVYLQYLKKYDTEVSKALLISKMKNKDFDCVILGHSIPLDGIDTEYLTNKGISSYNFALGGANIEASYIQLLNYLKFNKTKCVILGLSPGRNYKTFTPPPMHPAIEYAYNKTDYFSLMSIPVVKFQWRAIEVIKKMLSKDHREAKIVLGQLRTAKTIPDHSRYKEQPKKNINIDDFKNAKYLFKIDSLCKSNNIPFIALGMPGYKSTQNEFKLGMHELKYTNGNKLYYINMNNKEFCAKTFDTNKDWLGNSHLNEYGARKFTEYLYNGYLKDQMFK